MLWGVCRKNTYQRCAGIGSGLYFELFSLVLHPDQGRIEISFPSIPYPFCVPISDKCGYGNCTLAPQKPLAGKDILCIYGQIISQYGYFRPFIYIEQRQQATDKNILL